MLSSEELTNRGLAWALPQQVDGDEERTSLMVRPAYLEHNKNTNRFQAAESSTDAFFYLTRPKLSSLYPRGTVLFSEGQAARGVYLLLSGSAKISISSEQGKVLILRVARAGDLLGVNSTISGNPYEATAETLCQSRSVFVPRAEFVALHNEHEHVREYVLEAFSRHVSEMIASTRRILLSQTAHEKLLRLILQWCDEQGVGNTGQYSITNHFTQEEIAQMISASRETVTRLLTEFCNQGLLTIVGNRIIIHDRRALERTDFRKRLIDG